MNRRVTLLTRDGCASVRTGPARRLAQLAGELGFELSVTDVDAEAADGRPALRAEFGDRLPVVLLDGREHSYWEVDEPRLRADCADPREPSLVGAEIDTMQDVYSNFSCIT